MNNSQYKIIRKLINKQVSLSISNNKISEDIDLLADEIDSFYNGITNSELSELRKYLEVNKVWCEFENKDKRCNIKLSKELKDDYEETKKLIVKDNFEETKDFKLYEYLKLNKNLNGISKRIFQTKTNIKEIKIFKMAELMERYAVIFFQISGIKENHVCNRDGIYNFLFMNDDVDEKFKDSIKKKIENIIDKHYEIIQNLKTYRNKYQHALHKINVRSIGSHNEYSSFTFEWQGERYTISSSRLIKLTNELNLLFKAIVEKINIMNKKQSDINLDIEEIKHLFKPLTYDKYINRLESLIKT